MLCPIGQSNEKPPLQAFAKWWEHVTVRKTVGYWFIQFAQSPESLEIARPSNVSKRKVKKTGGKPPALDMPVSNCYI